MNRNRTPVSEYIPPNSPKPNNTYIFLDKYYKYRYIKAYTLKQAKYIYSNDPYNRYNNNFIRDIVQINSNGKIIPVKNYRSSRVIEA